MENVHRVDLEPIDEADAFAKMLQNGASIDDVSAKTGLSGQTIRRRLALADLCPVVKAAVQTQEVPLGIAEAMTLGTHDQQRSLLDDLRNGAELDRETIRDMLCEQKPSAAIAIFPLEQYTGTFTRDLFAQEETTYFDDVEQFFSLQQAAVEAFAEKERKKAAFVDLLHCYSVPWWQYREAEKGERGGVVINLHPSGVVETRKKLVRHEVKQEVVEATSETPEAPKERPETSAGVVRYAVMHKSIAVQAALLLHPRKAKEITAVCLLLGLLPSLRLSIDVHPCFKAWDESEHKPKALEAVSAELSRLSRLLGIQFDARRRPSLPDTSVDMPTALYAAVQGLSVEDLDRVNTVLVMLSFGQSSVDALDTRESLFNRVACDLGLTDRAWWMPDAEFLALLRKDQLEAVAIESGASLRMGKLKSYGKKELAETLAQYFARTADPAAKLNEHDEKGRSWLPGVMCFPAHTSVTSAHRD